MLSFHVQVSPSTTEELNNISNNHIQLEKKTPQCRGRINTMCTVPPTRSFQIEFQYKAPILRNKEFRVPCKEAQGLWG